MHVTHLGLVDFRSYGAVELDLPAGVTTFVGANGQGKTNLVEAIGYACSLRSHRVATDLPLVAGGRERAVVRVPRRPRPAVKVIMKLEITPGRANRARVNRSPVPRQRDVLGQVSRVLFAPEDLFLVKGDPGERPTYLDELTVALAPRFDAVLSRPGPGAQAAQLPAEVRLGAAWWRRPEPQRPPRRPCPSGTTNWPPSSAEVILARAALVARLAPPLSSGFRAVAPGDRDPLAHIEYVPGVPRCRSV